MNELTCSLCDYELTSFSTCPECGIHLETCPKDSIVLDKHWAKRVILPAAVCVWLAFSVLCFATMLACNLMVEHNARMKSALSDAHRSAFNGQNITRPEYPMDARVQRQAHEMFKNVIRATSNPPRQPSITRSVLVKSALMSHLPIGMFAFALGLMAVACPRSAGHTKSFGIRIRKGLSKYFFISGLILIALSLATALASIAVLFQ